MFPGDVAQLVRAGKEYKQLIIDNYIAIFKVYENKKKVFVLTVQYQGRQM